MLISKTKIEKPKKITSTEVIKPVKTFAEFVKSVWGYFMTFVAAVTFIWTMGAKSERKNNENISIKKDIIELKQEVKKIDSILVIIGDIQETQYIIIENQNAQRDSWVKYLVNRKDLTNKEFIEYMEGLEFRIMNEKTKTTSIDTIKKYNPKIVVTKIK